MNITDRQPLNSGDGFEESSDRTEKIKSSQVDDILHIR